LGEFDFGNSLSVMIMHVLLFLCGFDSCDPCPLAFSAQPPTSNSCNFFNSFLNQLQQLLLESLKSLFSDGSS